MKLIGNGGIRTLSPRLHEVWQFIEIDGMRQQRTRRVRCGKKDAREALRAFQNELVEQLPAADSFSSYVDSWLSWRTSSGRYSHATIKNCKSALGIFGKYIGNVSMTDITPQMCRDALIKMKEERGMSGTTARTKYAILHAMLAQAVKDGVITSNPLDAIDAPAIDTKERTALSPQELDALWHSTEKLPLNSYTMAVFLAIDCGMRIGECVWLEAKDVEENVIKVTRSKTKAGRGRMLPLTDRLAEKCTAWKQIRSDRGIADAPTFCCKLNGTEMSRTTLRHWYEKHRDEIGAPHRFHDLRHSNLSKMARYMSAHDLQRWAGWSSIAMAQRYVHDDFDQLVAAVKRSENVG